MYLYVCVFERICGCEWVYLYVCLWVCVSESEGLSLCLCECVYVFVLGLLDYGKNHNQDYFGQY